MNRSAGLGSISPTEWDRLQELADRLESSWKSGAVEQPGDWAAFLPAVGDPLRAPALRELIKTELEICWRLGRSVALEHYLQNYPELAATGGFPVDLIYEEYRVRHLFGDKPPLAIYQRRFPEKIQQLEQMLKQEPVPTPDMGTIAPTLTRPSPARPPVGGVEDARWASEQTRMGKTTVSKQVLRVVGDYELIERLGSGTFGEVWRGKAPGGVDVAIKIISRPLEHEEARRELEALELYKQLRHPFLLQTQAYWQLEGRLYIAMELADGSLRDYLKQRKQSDQAVMALDDLLRYFHEAADALDYLHAERVLHRDVKPDNILLLKGHAKVCDFGLVRLQREQWLFSASGSGTPAYMAPEVWAGKVCEHSDQYSLAVTYAELRLGKWPFANVMEAMHGTAPDLTPLGIAEQKVLRKALSKEPRNRFASCRQFVQALEAALKPQQAKQIHRRHFLWLGGAVLVTLGSVAGYLAFQHRDRLPEIALPKNCRASADSATTVDRTGRKFYNRIERILPSGAAVPFVLVPQEHEGDPPTFYIMETKVWNDLFAEFAEANPQDVEGSQWHLGGLANQKDLGVSNGRFPVLRVTVEEAHRFATWLGGLLPTPQQWDRAAGCYEGQSGPYRGEQWPMPGEPTVPPVAVDRANLGPVEVGTATHDQSIWGCKDMAGNGQEWTRMTDDGLLVPITGDKESVRLETRGRRYGHPGGPVRYSNKNVYKDEYCGSKPYLHPDPEVGFRVVIELLSGR